MLTPSQRAERALTAGHVMIWRVDEAVVAARVRDETTRRISDVYWSRAFGWSCTCAMPDWDACHHQLAVQRVTSHREAAAA